MNRELPEGWKIEATVHYDEHDKPHITPVHDPTDEEISDLSVHTVIVSYEDELGKDYRSIHGPIRDIDQLADYIETDLTRDSPVR